jgi:hypothetical protein
MKRFILSLAAGVVGLTLACGTASACDTKCNTRPAPAATPSPAPVVNPPARPTTPEEADLEQLLNKQRKQAGQGNLPVKPLPAQATNNAGPSGALARTPATPATATPATPVVRGPSQNDRIVKAVATQQALAAQNVLLEAKRAELQRWDRPAQEKFLRAFGTTDEGTRDRVIQRIDALIERNLQAMTTIADNLNFESFMENRKRQ